MLYTSKERWEHVEFRFSTKKYDFIEKNWIFFDFFKFRDKILVDHMSSTTNFSKNWKEIPKIDLLGPVECWKEQSHEKWTHLSHSPRSDGRSPAWGGSSSPPPCRIGLRRKMSKKFFCKYVWKKKCLKIAGRGLKSRFCPFLMPYYLKNTCNIVEAYKYTYKFLLRPKISKFCFEFPRGSCPVW